MNDIGSLSTSGTSRVYPSEYDILCGSGRECYEHPGNARFREIVSSWNGAYVRAETKVDKSKVVKTIIREILAPGTRFLKKHPIYSYWFVAPHQSKVQRDKISHFLREMAKLSRENAEEHELRDREHLVGRNVAGFQQQEYQLQQHEQDQQQESLRADIGDLITLAINGHTIQEKSKSDNSQPDKTMEFPVAAHLSQSQQNLLLVLGEEGLNVRSIQEMAKDPTNDIGTTPSTIKLCSLLASGNAGDNDDSRNSSMELGIALKSFEGDNNPEAIKQQQDSKQVTYLQPIVEHGEQELMTLQGECDYHCNLQQQPFVPQQYISKIDQHEYQQQQQQQEQLQHETVAATAAVATSPKLETLLMQEATKAVDDLANNEDTLRYLMSWLEEDKLPPVSASISSSSAAAGAASRGGHRRRNSFFI